MSDSHVPPTQRVPVRSVLFPHLRDNSRVGSSLHSFQNLGVYVKRTIERPGAFFGFIAIGELITESRDVCSIRDIDRIPLMLVAPLHGWPALVLVCLTLSRRLDASDQRVLHPGTRFLFSGRKVPFAIIVPRIIHSKVVCVKTPSGSLVVVTVPVRGQVDVLTHRLDSYLLTNIFIDELEQTLSIVFNGEPGRARDLASILRFELRDADGDFRDVDFFTARDVLLQFRCFRLVLFTPLHVRSDDPGERDDQATTRIARGYVIFLFAILILYVIAREKFLTVFQLIT